MTTLPPPQFRTYKLIYRRYAGLFFTIGVDVSDNALAYLETIHLFVELLDQYFSNVCELDIVFNFNKVCTPLPPVPVYLWSDSLCVRSAGLLHSRRVYPGRRSAGDQQKGDLMTKGLSRIKHNAALDLVRLFGGLCMFVAALL